MKIKVQCSCGTRFEFEVEPVNGRMPVALGCPNCGLDATELANAIIREQSAPPASGLRISKSHDEPTAAASIPVAQPAPSQAPASECCPKHPTEPVVESCRVCGKPICGKCMEQFGYVCSVYCRQQSEQKRVAVPVYSRQKSVVADRSYQIVKLVTLAVFVLVVAGLGFWGWYVWFARNPEVVYSLPIPVRVNAANEKILSDEFYQLISPGVILSVKAKHAGLYDITKQSSLWNVPLQNEGESAAALSNPEVAVSTNDLWLAFQDRVMRLDRKTGERKEPLIKGRILSFSSNAGTLMVVYLNPDGQRMLALISLSDASMLTAPILEVPTAPKPAAGALAKKGQGKSPPPVSNSGSNAKYLSVAAAVGRNLKAQPQPTDTLTASSPDPDDVPDNGNTPAIHYDYGEAPPFVLAGQTVVQFGSKLLEQKLITHESVKPKGKSVLDENITASHGIDLAQEMANDSQREATGGVEVEDVSRYQVTLHRWFADSAPDWTGEVTGPPRVYALQTVDLLVAGQSLLVFDHHNKKLWEGKLTYASHALADQPPALETKDALYFADAGVLTRFDLATGNVRWRLDSVGISAVHADDHGDLYIASTTASPDQIAHPHQVNLRDKIHPILLNVDPESGRVLWRLESVGSDCFLSGKFLYSTWVTSVQSALKLEEGPDTHYNLKLLDPANGHEIWIYHKVNRPVLKTEVQQNWILLQYEDGVSVLKFFSF